MRIQHAESQQQTEDGAGGANGRVEVVREPLHHKQLRHRRDDGTDEIVNDEVTRAERAFDRAAEHVQRQHVEQDVGKTPMHKGIGHQLPRPETQRYDLTVGERATGVRPPRPKREVLGQRKRARIMQQVLQCKHHHVGDQQIAGGDG